MVFRKELSESLREAQIKETLKRLTDAGMIRVIGEKNSHKGNTYEVVQ
jgi:chromosome segregation and condensation protein ScpB